MLDFLKRNFKPAATAASEKGDIEMSESQKASFEATIAQLTASLAEANDNTTALKASFEEVKATNEKLQAALNASESAQKELAAQAKAKVVAERTSKLEGVIGSVQAKNMVASLETLDESAFNLVVESMAANFKKEADSPLFKEAGVDVAAQVQEEKPVSFTKFTK